MEFNTMTVKQLKEYAEINNIDLYKISKKNDIIKAIEEQTENNIKMQSAEYIINTLLNSNNKTRCLNLNITEGLFANKKLAKKWYFRLSKKIHPDTCKLENSNMAFMKLKEIYENYMI